MVLFNSSILRYLKNKFSFNFMLSFQSHVQHELNLALNNQEI